MPKSNSVSTPQPLASAGGTDTVYAIEAANPELADIIKSLKTTYAVLGGQFEDNTKTLDTTTFDGRRTLIQHELHRLEVQCDTKANAGLNPRSKDFIRLKLQIEKGLGSVKGHFAELRRINDKDSSKGKIKAGDGQRRGEDLMSIAREVQRVQMLYRGEATLAQGDAESGAARGGMQVIGIGELEEGAKPGQPPRRVVQQEMTAQQQMQLSGVRSTIREQDELLDQIMLKLGDLEQINQQIGDELELQTEMLADTEEQMDRTQSTLDKVNGRLDETLKVANAKSTTFCSYAICVFILLGIGVVLFNLISG